MKRLRASIAAVPVLLAAFLAAPSAQAEVVPPEFTDGSGLTLAGDAVSDPKNPTSGFVITVTTPEVAGKHPIRIILPADYATSPTKRYPVLYLLHGTGDNPTNPSLAYPAIRSTIARSSMITVIPDGGLRGWYNDWLMQNTAAGAQKWETFHLKQVIPFIDANLRTIGTKQGRAIAGISMGGFGALHYAQRRPDLFSQVATLSGANDLSLAYVRSAVVATELNATGAICAISSSGSGGASSGEGTCSGFGPVVSSDAIFGSPYWWGANGGDWYWTQRNPVSNMRALAGMGISIYTGNNSFVESVVEAAAKNTKASLDRLGYPYHYVNYGDGSSWGTGCDGKHWTGGAGAYNCWSQDLVDLIPRLEQSLTPAS
ncbi:alpha/beta hydrolase [Actinomadura kijaniata]|uniref:alpha/beta hydrolase n=1 Tax=Actinomadura kijaniata TaxID=46161 RepID=UPI0008316E65|nr:alpha/beta hydrolase-fold protein [Actinomadura kijaniata]